MKDLRYRANNNTYDFQKYERTRFFGDNISTGKISVDVAETNKTNFLENVLDINNRPRPNKEESKSKEKILMKVYMLFMKVQNLSLMLSKVEYFQ